MPDKPSTEIPSTILSRFCSNSAGCPLIFVFNLKSPFLSINPSIEPHLPTLKIFYSHKVSPNTTIRSRDQHLLAVPRSFTKTFGDRSFEHAAPKLYNTIPLEIRKYANIDIFKRKLKTHFFELAYYQ